MLTNFLDYFESGQAELHVGKPILKTIITWSSVLDSTVPAFHGSREIKMYSIKGSPRPITASLKSCFETTGRSNLTKPKTFPTEG